MVKFHIEKTEVPKGLDEEVGPCFKERGIFLHKQCERFLTGQVLEPFNCAYTEIQFQHFVAPYLEPLKSDILGVELELFAELTPNVQGKGIIDLLRPRIAYDWKFTNKPWNAHKLKWYEDFQAFIYFWLLEENGHEVDFLEYVIFPWGEPPQTFKVMNDTHRVAIEKRKWLATVAQIESAYEMEFWLASPSKWNCKFCDFRTICPFSEA